MPHYREREREREREKERDGDVVAVEVGARSIVGGCRKGDGVRRLRQGLGRAQGLAKKETEKNCKRGNF